MEGGDGDGGAGDMEVRDLTRQAEGVGEDGSWAERYPDAFRASVADSQAWSRVIRPPRKRGKHVVLDLCSAGQTEGVTDHSRGVLLRQVVARSQRGGLVGPQGYRLGRKLRWGDLWPLPYQRLGKVLHQPPSD